MVKKVQGIQSHPVAAEHITDQNVKRDLTNMSSHWCLKVAVFAFFLNSEPSHTLGYKLLYWFVSYSEIP